MRRENTDIFPNIIEWSTSDTRTNLHIMTYLRKKEEGVYYLIQVQKSFSIKIDININARIANCYKSFISEVYKAIVLGKVNLDLRDVAGQNIFERDDNQESEEERLTKLISI